MLFAYLYKYLCWAVSILWRLATISNMNPKDELREGFIVQTGNRSKNHLNKPIMYQINFLYVSKEINQINCDATSAQHYHLPDRSSPRVHAEEHPSSLTYDLEH